MSIYNQIISENQAWIDGIFAKLDQKLSRVAVKSRDKIPYTVENGVHNSCTDPDHPRGITWWTNGFWGGLMWLMYEATKNEEYLTTAKNAEVIMDGALKQFEKLHHDVGFMWHIMSGAAYRLTGDKASRTRALYAAATLAGRYNLSGGFIRAWNGKDQAGWTIIDCLMNIPLLYWASREIGDDRYAQIAMAHADMALRDHVRYDGSSVHICCHDTATGELVATRGGQGYCEGSCWSRGIGWGIYGFVLSYIHTGKEEYLEASKRLAHYYIANIAADDYLPRVDFRAPLDPERYDSSAGAICACGLIELAKHVPEEEKRMYLSAAIKSLKAMEKWYDWSDENDSVLQMSTGAYNNEIHVNYIYGDYFLTEAILKLKGSEFLPW